MLPLRLLRVPGRASNRRLFKGDQSRMSISRRHGRAQELFARASAAADHGLGGGGHHKLFVHFLDALPLAKEKRLDSAGHSTEPQPVAVSG
jgi:hypothetical protein